MYAVCCYRYRTFSGLRVCVRWRRQLWGTGARGHVDAVLCLIFHFIEKNEKDIPDSFVTQCSHILRYFTYMT